ncbi:MAG: sialate O-acetylesterase [Balneolaceae bacterium]
MFLLCLPAYAQKLELPLIFNDGMVLQRDSDVRFWGWAEAGSEIIIHLGDYSQKTVTDDDGNWETYLPPQEAGGPFEISISGDETITLKDVYFGDVWLAGGQSNMEWKLEWKVDNWEEEIARSAEFPEIRFFEVPQATSYKPQQKLTGGEWKTAHPDNAGNFSAVAWHFAKLNNLEKGVPVGIVESNWGGTPAESWTPATRLLSVKGYEEAAKEVLDTAKVWEEEFAKNEEREEQKWALVESPEVGLQNGVHQTDFNDSEWKVISLPTEKPVTDVVWLRRSFIVDDAEIESARLFSGDVVQESFFFINGKEVGAKSWQQSHTEFEVGSELLKSGENVIALRAVNSWDNNVMVGGNNNISLTINDKKLDLTGEWKYSNTIEPKMPKVTRYEWVPAFLYNSMIHPLAGYSMKGAIWYQGESNVEENQFYNELFEAMIEEWRSSWGQGDFPFLFVQLANYLDKKDQPFDSGWARLREAQTQALQLKNTAMATTIDIGVADDIHPRNKQDVGKRLWLAAEKVVFGKDVVYSGPAYRDHSVEGNKVR